MKVSRVRPELKAFCKNRKNVGKELQKLYIIEINFAYPDAVITFVFTF